MHVCLVIPEPGEHAGRVMAAVRDVHDDPVFSSVWAGDPQLRPTAPVDAPWIDLALAGVEAPDGVDWNRLLLALPAAAYGVARGCAAVARTLPQSPQPIVLLRVGAVGVVGALDQLAPATGVAVAVRRSTAIPADGFAPTVADLSSVGRYSTAVIGFAPDAADVAAAVARIVVAGGCQDDPGPALAAAIDWALCELQESTAVDVVGWSEPGGEPVAVDVTHLDRDEEWRVGFDHPAPRVRLSERPDITDMLTRTARQWHGINHDLAVPGGIAVDSTIRELVAEAVAAARRGEGTLPPDPWADPTAFITWLETPWPPWGPDIGRYWSRLWGDRPDLADAFPNPEGRDLEAFTEWATHSWRREPRSPLLRPTSRPMRPSWHDESRRPGGVNLIGYFGFDKSLGDLARRMRACLDAAGVPVAALDYRRSGSPPTKERVDTTDRVVFDTNVIIVNPDQIELFDADYGAVVRPGRRTIGFWHWDVEYVPRHVVEATRYVDEIWVVSPFTADALRGVVGVPVRVVDVPVPEPSPAAAVPDGFEMTPDRFDFLVTFDYLSVTERKNPIGAIEAFQRAFPEPRGDVAMLVKSVNASHRWIEHERVRLAAGSRPDIRVVDCHLTRGDQLALIANAGCLVSLHRSEGLGLHLIEAMWLGTPTIATRYSGNLYFMDDSNSALVDAALVPVTRGEGFFPPAARWADPDLDLAAEWMRKLVADPSLGAALAKAGRAKMLSQATQAEAGAAIARWGQVRLRSDREGP